MNLVDVKRITEDQRALANPKKRFVKRKTKATVKTEHNDERTLVTGSEYPATL